MKQIICLLAFWAGIGHSFGQKLVLRGIGKALTLRTTGRSIVARLPPPAADTSGYYVLSLVPDFERRNGAVVGNTVQMYGRTAVLSDVGKSVVVKAARKYTAFRQAPISWNGTVTGISGGKLLVGGSFANPVNQLFDTANVEVVLGTNYWAAINTGIQTAISLNKHLFLNWTGTVYVNPLQSDVFANLFSPTADVLRGWLVDTDSLHIRGRDSALTKIKFGPEDFAYEPGSTATPFFYAFGNSAKLEIDHCTFIAPDRGSTMSNGTMAFMHGYGGARSAWLHDMQVLSPHLESGWMEGVTELNRFGGDGVGFSGRKLINSIRNSRIEAAATFTMYSQNGPVKRLDLRNVRITGGGRKIWLGPYKNCLQTTFSDAQGVITVNHPEATWYQSITNEWESYHPYCLLFPPAQDTLDVTYDGPGQNGQNIYDHGQFFITNKTQNLADGQDHFIMFRWKNGVDPATQSYNFTPDHYFTLARTTHTNSSQQILGEDGGHASYGYFVRAMKSGLPVRIKLVSGQLQLLDPLDGYIKDITSPNTATLWHAAPADGQANYTASFTAAEMAVLQGGSIIMQGRPQSTGYGHVLYTHTNVEQYLDSIYLNMDGRNGQYTNYAIRVSAAAQTPGPNTVFHVRHWYAPVQQGYYWKSSLSYIQPSVQIFNSIEPGSLVFTGRGVFGTSVRAAAPITFPGQIGILYDEVGD